MTANHDLPRRLAHYYETEPPLRAPDWVLQSALSTIETTPQRRGLAVLRRYPTLSNYTKLAAAAVAVIAVGGFALWQLAPGGPGGTPAPSPLSTVAPSPTAAPTARPEPTTYVPGALTQTFTSDLHGLSLKYPEGWAAEAATEPWTEGPPPVWSDPTGDKLYDATLDEAHLFLAVVSRPLDGASLEDWFAGLSREECTLGAGGTVNGADRVLRADCVEVDLVVASSGGRGYVFELRASPDDVQLQTLDTSALLDAILATVQLLPEDAVDE